MLAMNRAAMRVAVIGAGIAGASCARQLASAGVEVQVFDKSRGVGGRLTTRRMDWPGADSQAAFDHGAPAFTAHAPAFAEFAAQAARDGILAPWPARAAPGSRPRLEQGTLWTPTPDMPALCRALLADLPLELNCQIDALRRAPDGWRLEAKGETVARGYAAVVIAIPPAQAAALLEPHQPEWARQALALPMLPGWTLMGLASEAGAAEEWDIAWPDKGPLATVVRNHTKPGRQGIAGQCHWVAHAGSDWSARHLEAPAAQVQAELQQALADWLGWTPDWRYAAAHRWRYASAPAAAAARPCWWDADTSVGVCGDAWGGGGVEGAWLSARVLASAIAGGGGGGGAA